MSADPSERDPRQLSASIRLVLARYIAQIRTRPVLGFGGLVLPGIGDIFVWYLPPLVIARLLTAFQDGSRLDAAALTPYLLTFAGVWLFGEALWRLAASVLARVEIQGMQRLYAEALDELLAKDLAFFHDNFAGSLTKRALQYARRFENFFDILSFNVVAHLIPLVFASVILWRFSPWLVAALFGMITLTLAIITPLIRRRRALVDLREAASTKLAGHLSDSITNMEAVRAFAREDDEAKIHATNVHDYGRKALRSWEYQNLRVDTVTSPMFVLTNVLGIMIAIAVSNGTGASLETVFVTFSYFATSTRIMWEFNRIYRNMESTLTEAAQFTELLLEPPAVLDRTDAQPLVPTDFGVSFETVRFTHPGRTEPLFDDFSFAIASGEHVGLVGRSGGGKSTITRLLLRFMDVDAGAIRIGGQDIAAIPQASLRGTIAYVPQDPSMFHRTLADNIRFGRPTATDEEVRHAANLAHAAEFVAEFPLGYETLVGERGVKLSGGQRQRIAIARAILKDAPILVLDEATSSLDSESEALIQDALWTLMAGRTAIVIAHRLSTVRQMDRLIVLDQGRILEQGSHAELLARGGTYASLWSHQSGGFLPAADDLENLSA